VGVYNCAGMVWASRRAALTEPHEWEIILKEDCYRRLADRSEAEIGDVVVYRSRANKEILHVAKVCKIDELVLGEGYGTRRVPRALSKWDQRCGEDVHELEDVNLSGNTPFAIEVWTDRPSGPDPRIEHIAKLPLIT